MGNIHSATNQKIDLSVLKKGFEEYLENKAVSEGKAGEVSYEHGATLKANWMKRRKPLKRKPQAN